MKLLLILIITVLFTMIAISCNKSKETIKEMGNDAQRTTEQTVRDVKDEACEMINGKMECAADKVKHKVQDGADAVEDAMD
jgi:competence protein ComGC